jgi:hypothetical protein
LSNMQANVIEYLMSRIDLSRLECIIFNNCASENETTCSFCKYFFDSNRSILFFEPTKILVV